MKSGVGKKVFETTKIVAKCWSWSWTKTVEAGALEREIELLKQKELWRVV